MRTIDKIRRLREIARPPVKEGRLQDFRTGGVRMMWEPWKDPNWQEYKRLWESMPKWLVNLLYKLRII